MMGRCRKILDVLAAECVKATFFVIGRMARQSDVVRRGRSAATRRRTPRAGPAKKWKV
jgi:peptidoglycan/xylan/chitin deacetylase (PgdA/CDA1 family)